MAQNDLQLNERYIVCQSCDAIWERPTLGPDQKAKCLRCHDVIYENKHRSWERVLPASIGASILYIAAISFPFLSMERSGLTNRISVLDTPGVLMANDMYALGLAVFLFILVFPICQIGLLYALIISHYLHLRSKFSAKILRLFQAMAPWAMAEIFIIGVIVSLVKLGAMVNISIGPAFWAMIGFVSVMTMIATHWCRFTAWEEIEVRNEF